MEKKHHIVYRTTNKVNGRFYIGVHSTDDLEDGYIGSGVALNEALKKYGKKSFERTILFECTSRQEAFDIEAKLVDDNFTSSSDNYNISRGGGASVSINSISKTHILLKGGEWIQKDDFDPKTHTAFSKDMIVVRDSDGNRFTVHRDDERYLSGELVPWNKGILQSAESNKKRSETQKKKAWSKYCDVCNREVGGFGANWTKHLNSGDHLKNLNSLKK